MLKTSLYRLKKFRKEVHGQMRKAIASALGHISVEYLICDNTTFTQNS